MCTDQNTEPESDGGLVVAGRSIKVMKNHNVNICECEISMTIMFE